MWLWTPSFGSNLKEGACWSSFTNQSLGLNLVINLGIDGININQDRSALSFDDAAAESTAVAYFVIVTRVARPAGGHPNGNVSGIYNAMSDFASDVVQAAGCHIFKPGAARAVHEQEFPGARNCAIEFGAIADYVPVPAGHEIFPAHATRLDFRKSPEQAAVSAGCDGFPPPDSVDYGFGIELLPRLLVAKDSCKLSELLFRHFEPLDLQSAVGPVHEPEDRIHNRKDRKSTR